MLWAFTIEHALDTDGNLIPVDPYYIQCHVVSHCSIHSENVSFSLCSEPRAFPLRLAPRSSMHADKIREEFASPTLEERRVLSIKIGLAPFDKLKVFSHD